MADVASLEAPRCLLSRACADHVTRFAHRTVYLPALPCTLMFVLFRHSRRRSASSSRRSAWRIAAAPITRTTSTRFVFQMNMFIVHRSRRNIRDETNGLVFVFAFVSFLLAVHAGQHSRDAAQLPGRPRRVRQTLRLGKVRHVARSVEKEMHCL